MGYMCAYSLANSLLILIFKVHYSLFDDDSEGIDNGPNDLAVVFWFTKGGYLFNSYIYFAF